MEVDAVNRLAPPTLLDVSVLAAGLDHPEGVAWGQDQHVYAGGEAGQIYRISGTGQVAQIASTGGFVLGLCLDGTNQIYACDLKRREVVRITAGGVVQSYSRGPREMPFVAPNFPAFDSEGFLYVTDSGTYRRNDGRLQSTNPLPERDRPTSAGPVRLHLSNDIGARPAEALVSGDAARDSGRRTTEPRDRTRDLHHNEVVEVHFSSLRPLTLA